MKNTVNYKGFEFEYNLNYTPAERRSFDYEGNDEEFEITDITLNGIDAYDLLENQIDEFEEYIINEFKDYN